MTDPATPMTTSSAVQALVVAAAQGDATAFEMLVSSRLHRTHRMALAILGSTTDAGDAVQDAWLTAWRMLPRLREPDRFDAWMDRIVVNSCRMSLRRRARVREIPFAEDLEHRTAAPGPEHVAEREVLERAFGRLTVDQRTILVLHHLEQRPVSTIAQILSIPVGTAKSRLHAARTALERALEIDR